MDIPGAYPRIAFLTAYDLREIKRWSWATTMAILEAGFDDATAILALPEAAAHHQWDGTA